jgi:hypothetical protein
MAKAERGRHFVFAGVNALARGPGSLAFGPAAWFRAACPAIIVVNGCGGKPSTHLHHSIECWRKIWILHSNEEFTIQRLFSSHA